MEEPSTAAQTDPGTSTNDSAAAGQSKPAVAKDMHVKVYAPFHVYFDDQALSISALNDTGPFDILPGHRNFMTLVSPCDLIIRTTEGEKKIKIARAVMHVKANDVIVFLDV